MKRQVKYDKENSVRISLKLNKKHDADILDAIGRLENFENESKQGAIKKLIRKSFTN